MAFWNTARKEHNNYDVGTYYETREGVVVQVVDMSGRTYLQKGDDLRNDPDLHATHQACDAACGDNYSTPDG